MTPPTLRAIKCSERMPTREDADAHGHVLWLIVDTYYLRRWDASLGLEYWVSTHFFPLNRSAVATDAEEQT